MKVLQSKVNEVPYKSHNPKENNQVSKRKQVILANLMVSREITLRLAHG